VGTLYIVGTPIGNLEDISQRALRTLRQVSLIAAESPARTQRLLARYDIRTPMMRYTDAYDRKKRVRIQAVLTAMEEGDVALVSEAGMPGLADPGYELLRAAIERGVPVVPVPGPTAVTAALSVSGLPTERYVFVGFLPRKRAARREFLMSLVATPYPIVAYESPHRLLKTLEDIQAIFGRRPMSISCELTKLYEETRHGTADEALAHFQTHEPRGEFTLVIAAPLFGLLDRVREIVDGPLERTDKLQTICRLLREQVPHYDWVGFYLADGTKRELVLGPFEGEPTEHVRIPFGRGICGQAAEIKRTFIVQDVSKETNYLSCSPRVKSEIVLPILKDGEVVGELDIDSHVLAPFAEGDKEFLENVCGLVSRLF